MLRLVVLIILVVRVDTVLVIRVLDVAFRDELIGTFNVVLLVTRWRFD